MCKQHCGMIENIFVYRLRFISRGTREAAGLNKCMLLHFKSWLQKTFDCFLLFGHKYKKHSSKYSKTFFNIAFLLTQRSDYSVTGNTWIDSMFESLLIRTITISSSGIGVLQWNNHQQVSEQQSDKWTIKLRVWEPLNCYSTWE